VNACLLDTGPLVALLDRSEPDHNRVSTFMTQLRGHRLITTGAVITEVFYFLSDVQHGPASLVSSSMPAQPRCAIALIPKPSLPPSG
jgi:predicted nucleic acid-binding protein